ALSRPRNKPTWVPVSEAQGRTPVLGALPARMAIVAASFPYKQQVEEFKHKLRLPSHGAVLIEQVSGEGGKTWPSFRFDGLDIERMTVNPDGSDGKWLPLDVGGNYLKFVLITNRSLEKDDPKYAPVLPVGRGLGMRVPAQFPEFGRHPDLVGKLVNIKNTLEKLKRWDVKELVPSPVRRETIHPFDLDNITHDGPGDKPPPGTEGLKKLKETPIKHCLLRFVDVTVESGKSYKYRLRVRMMNPSSPPGPEQRKDPRPQLARDKVLKPEWVRVPLVVTVPPDQVVYALDLAAAGPRLNTWLKSVEPWRWTFPPFPPAQAPNQATV